MFADPATMLKLPILSMILTSIELILLVIPIGFHPRLPCQTATVFFVVTHGTWEESDPP